MARGATAARALKAGCPEAFVPPLPEWLQAVDGDDTYEWARVAWRQASLVDGAWFDHQLAESIVEDWPKWARLTLDRFAGVKFRLTTWQDISVRLLVGWMLPISVLDPETHEATTLHVRLFRRFMLWIPRKNGKSEFLAALALLFFAIDGTHKGEGYVFARKDDQARIVFNRMAAMVAANDEFKDEIIVYSQSLYVKALASSFSVLSGSEEGLHGKAPTVIVGDEMHEWKSLVIANTLRQGTGNRLEPIELYASTAGRKTGGKQSVGEQLYKESADIVSCRKVMPRTLAVIFAANDNDDPGDPRTWRKGNPNLGLSPTEDFLREEYTNAVGNPRALAEFKCYHLGIWADETVRWLPLKKWDACAEDTKAWRQYPELFKGRRCVAAFDVSSTTDITALILLFYPTEADPRWRVVCRFWVPEDQVSKRVAEGAPLDRFLDAKAMETTPGDYVDQNHVGKALLDAAALYDIEKIGFDPWNARKLYTDLCSGGITLDGEKVDAPPMDAAKFVELRQGILTLGEPSKIFERLVFAGELDHGGDPVLRWMAGNVVIHFDRNLNFMPAKDRSADKIDGIVALVMCVALACVDETEAPPSSPWEDETFSIARAA